MKNTAIILVLMMGLVGGVSAQTESVRSVSGFSSIANAGTFAVHVRISGTESLKIEGADAETLSNIETSIKGGNLEIRWKYGTERNHYSPKVDVYVTAKSLTGLSCSGSGSIDVDGVVSGGEVSVTLSGSGRITSQVSTTGKLQSTISGSGAVNLKGKAAETDLTISGSGKFGSDGLSSDVLEVMISGSGSAYMTVNKTISGSIVGSGSVEYSGNATLGSVSTVGSGRIRKV